MDQLLDAGAAAAGGASLSSILAIFKISAGETTIETLFQSLIDGLISFVKSLFATLPSIEG